MDLELCPDEGPDGLLASGDEGVDVPDEFCNAREDFPSSLAKLLELSRTTVCVGLRATGASAAPPFAAPRI
jgi:hypothetical protein